MQAETIDPQCLFAATNYPTPTSEHATSPLAQEPSENAFEFWVAPGSDACTNSIWYRPQLEERQDGTPTWGDATNCELHGASGMAVAPGSSPCTVRYKGQLYLFFQGLGRSGTLYTVHDDVSRRWSEIQSVSAQAEQVISRCTSPSAVVYDGMIYLFWSGPLKERNSYASGIWYSTFDGNHWTPSEYCADNGAHGVEVAYYTSPSAHANDSGLYLFFTGTEHDIHYTRGTAIMDHVIYWDRPLSVGRNFSGGLSVLQHTSPSVVAGPASDKALWRSEFLLMWTEDGSGGRQGVNYALYASERWSPPRALATDIARTGKPTTNVNAVAALLAEMSRLFCGTAPNKGPSLDSVTRLAKSPTFNQEELYWSAPHHL